MSIFKKEYIFRCPECGMHFKRSGHLIPGALVNKKNEEEVKYWAKCFHCGVSQWLVPKKVE